MKWIKKFESKNHWRKIGIMEWSVFRSKNPCLELELRELDRLVNFFSDYSNMDMVYYTKSRKIKNHPKATFIDGIHVSKTVDVKFWAIVNFDDKKKDWASITIYRHYDEWFSVKMDTSISNSKFYVEIDQITSLIELLNHLLKSVSRKSE